MKTMNRKLRRTAKTIREIAAILFYSAGLTSVLAITTAAFWWHEPTGTVAAIFGWTYLAMAAILTLASLHSEFRLVVRVERRGR